MKGIDEKESKELKNKLLLGAGGFIVFATLLLLIFIKKFSYAGPITTKMNNKETFLIYIDNGKCDNCEKIKEFLEEKNVSYEELNEYDQETKELLQKNNFDLTKTISPAVLYIKKGSLYANLVNINATDELELFIKNYKLSK